MGFFSATVLASSFINRNLYDTRDPFFAALVFCVTLISFVFISVYAWKKDDLQREFNIFRILGTFILIFTDFNVFLTKDIRSETQYLIGNKFTVAYFHLLIIVLWVYQYEKKKDFYSKSFIVVLICLCAVSGIHMECNTGIIALLLMVVWFYLIKKFSTLFLNPLFSVALLIVSFSYIFIYKAVLNNDLIKEFVINVLHRDLSMTGRTGIYSILPDILSRRLFTGYGYGVSYEVLSKYVNGNIPDTQNGLAEWFFYGGLFTALSITIILFYIMSKIEKHDAAVLAAISMLYAYVCIATVEISLNGDFFAILAMIYITSKGKNVTRIDKKNYFSRKSLIGNVC